MNYLEMAGGGRFVDVCVRNLGRGVEGGVGRSANKKIPEPEQNII